MKALQISRTKWRGVGITCGGRVRDTAHKSFVSAKAQSAKDHQRQGYTWVKSDIITQTNERGFHKGNICCCPRGRRNASFVKIRFLMKDPEKGPISVLGAISEVGLGEAAINQGFSAIMM